jgi:dolichol-phosphate mannosyltransferase
MEASMNTKDNFLLSIVVPVMNEAGNIDKLINKIDESIGTQYNYEIIFVDDGSTDNTLQIIKDEVKSRGGGGG